MLTSKELPNKRLHPTANSAALIENLAVSQVSARRVNRGVRLLRISRVMSREDTFPLSPTNTKRAVALSIAYGLLVIIAGCFYIIASGDRSWPRHYLMLVAVISVCAWGISSRRKWAWSLAAVFAAWQIYYGASNLILFLNAGVMRASTSGKVIAGLLALRTVTLLALLLLLMFLADHRKLYNG